ncbi:MAG: DUF2066 domain-containing protein, partial [Hyphomicrobiaceae bacterium]|nr:DUF2066 domain-containing protein [Hyphomicrobiaceae bacterium]
MTRVAPLNKAGHHLGRVAAALTISGLAISGLTIATLTISGLTIACAVTASTAHAASSAAYTVGNYPVEAQARDAVAAKNLAIASGQDAAFRSLLRRLVPVTAYKRLKKLPAAKPTDFAEGVAVRKERNSPTEYLATLDFSFDQQSVRNYLSRNGIPYVDEQAPPVMLIPAWRETPGGPLQAGKGPWFDAWSSLDLTHSLAPLRLEGLKPEITADVIKTVVDGGGVTGRAFTGAYRTDSVLVALAEPDTTGKKLMVTLAGQDAVGPFVLKRAYRIQGGDRAYTAELAAVIGLGILEGRWKAAKAGAIGGVDVTDGGGSIRLTVEYGSLAEWNDLRGRLLDTDGAYDLEVGTVSARSAEVSV